MRQKNSLGIEMEDSKEKVKKEKQDGVGHKQTRTHVLLWLSPWGTECGYSDLTG